MIDEEAKLERYVQEEEERGADAPAAPARGEPLLSALVRALLRMEKDKSKAQRLVPSACCQIRAGERRERWRRPSPRNLQARADRGPPAPTGL